MKKKEKAPAGKPEREREIDEMVEFWARFGFDASAVACGIAIAALIVSLLT